MKANPEMIQRKNDILEHQKNKRNKFLAQEVQELEVKHVQKVKTGINKMASYDGFVERQMMFIQK